MKARTIVGIMAVVQMTLCSAVAGFGQTYDFHGQLSSWFLLNNPEPSTQVLGALYLPTLSVGQTLPKGQSVDAEASVNAFASGQFQSSRDVDTSARLKPYRLWSRFKTSRFEARAGLQKINFGSATLLRPLMWFDGVDPRDPLQITDGVYGVLLRYYTSKNAAVWAWGLYGNQRLKGWEQNPTREGTPEFGGRIQVPVPRGEMAFSTHHRRADLSKGLVSAAIVGNPVAGEHRYAVDGKWDVGIGVWFEGAWSHQSRADLVAPDQGAATVGADYTFGLGNGLHILGEYFILENSRGLSQTGQDARLSAASASYRVGLLDTVSGIFYFDHQRHEAYRFVNWQRTYDHWQFHVMGFWNPSQAAIRQNPLGESAGRSPQAGTGFQLMTVFNH